MTTRILFVCLGNICRSPAAEGVVRHMSQGLELDSAGTGQWHIGNPPHQDMIEAAKARGYDLSGLRARLFTAEDFAHFDLILGMDADNLRAIERLRGAAQVPVRRFTDYCGGPETAVPDPYYTGDFHGTLDLIERCATGLLREIAPER